MIKYISLTFFLCHVISSAAQIGGESVYEFLNLSNTARITGLGGNLITVKDDDAALAYHNPSVLNAKMHNQLSFNISPYFADISHGYASYARHFDELKATFYGGIQYIDYGDFNTTNETGQIIGTFSAAEYAFSVGGGFQYSERLSLGANVKFISSQLASYNSIGIAADFGAFYEDTSKLLTAALVIKNMGAQLTSYFPDNRERLPFDVQIGISKRLRYLPFRFSIIIHNLHRWDIRYDDPDVQETVLTFGEESTTTTEQSFFFDTFFRHFIFNGEFLLGKRENFRLRLGYNHIRRGELSVPQTISFSGFTFGIGLKIKNFRIDYGRGIYHLAGGVNHFTLSTNLSDFKR